MTWEQRVEAAARAAYGAHYRRYMNMMEKALAAAFPDHARSAPRAAETDKLSSVDERDISHG